VTPSSDILARFFNEIGIIAQLSQSAFERVMPEGMTMAQFTVLNHFVRLGGTKRPMDIARAFQVTRATMSSTLSRLEGKGLVATTPDPEDGRAKHVGITEAGRAMREACLAALGPEFARLAPLLAASRIEELLPALSEIRSILDKARD